MDIRFQEIEKHSRTQQVVEEIKRAVAGGTIKIGDKLPPERDLALQFGVSRTSIREAVRILSTLGLVKTTQGGGTYVTDLFSENVFSFLGFGSRLSRENYKLLFQARFVLESGCIPFVLDKVNTKDIERLKSIVEDLKNETDIQRLGLLDARFHESLVELAGNPILSSLYQMIYKMLKEGTSKVISYPNGKKLAIRDHYSIIQAIETKSKAKCIRAVEKHLAAAAGLFEKFFNEPR
jgi:GntR family transcriptional repressor for pyruvate dehydrogenase complex